MRKKYLSALLFGALLVTSTGTFTSCKDYDDDINNLQEQIDKLATKEDMEAKLSQMQSAIDAAKTTAEEALAKAEAAGDSEEVNDLKERVAALEEAMAKVEELKAEIKTMVDEQLAEFRVEMQEFMKEVEELTGYSLTMITEISFVNETEIPLLTVGFARVDNLSYPKDLYEGGESQTPESYVFGEGMTGAFTVTKNDVNTVKDDMLVKVAPVDAVISSDMLSLINGKGENLNNYVELTSKTWSDDIISRATSKTGLYNIGVQLKSDVDFEALDKLLLADGGQHSLDPSCSGKHDYKMFALAVSDAEKSRTVTSDYKVSLHVQETAKVTSLENSKLSSGADSKTLGNYGATISNDDNGSFQVVNGTEFSLKVIPTDGKVMASYVVLDADNPARGLSTTDKAALKSIEITGVNNVITDDTHKLTVTGEAGVAIPLKLVAIDYHGTVLVDYFWVSSAVPALVTASYDITTSKYIETGENGAVLWNPTSAGVDAKAFMQPFTIPATAAKTVIDIKAGEKYAESDGQVIGDDESEISMLNVFSGEDNLQYFEYYDKNKDKLEGDNIPNSDVAYAVFKGDLNLKAMREDKTYTGTVKYYDEQGNYLGLNTIKLTKKLPTDVPSNFSAKTNSIDNGVMTVYPQPNDSKKGSYILNNSFINWTNSAKINDASKISKANAFGYWLTIDKLTDNVDPILATFDGENKTADSKPASLIDKIEVDVLGNGETYPSVVSYNYGDIKYVPVGHGVVGAANHTVEWSTKFAMKFGYWPADCEYSWTGTPEVIYGVDQEILGKANVDKDGNITSYDNVIKVLSPYGVEVNPFDGTDTDNKTDWNIWAPNLLATSSLSSEPRTTITLVTYDESGKKNENEFFTATFETKTVGTAPNDVSSTMIQLKRNPSTTVVLRDNVETTVVINFTDKFGKERHVEALKFIMKKSAK